MWFHWEERRWVLVKLNTPYKLCGCQCMVLCTAQFTDSIVKHLLLCQVQDKHLCCARIITPHQLGTYNLSGEKLHYYITTCLIRSQAIVFFFQMLYFASTLVKPCGCCTGRSTGHQQSSRRGVNVLQWRWGWADILHLYLRALIMLFKEVDNSTTNSAPPESHLVGCLALLAWHPFSGGWNLQPPKYSHYAKPSKPKDPSWPYYACKHS
jgi:hypothetical protein